MQPVFSAAGVEVQDAAGASAVGLDGVAADGLERLMDALITLRADARASKDFATADARRAGVAGAGLRFEDGPEGTRWVQAD